MKAAQDRYGTASWQRILSPIVNLARKGVEIDSVTASSIQSSWDTFNDAAKEVFSDENGEPLEEGDLLVQEDLAKTFQLIRKEGVSPFYEGEIAEAFVDTVQAGGSTMTVDDLGDYEISFDEPMHSEYKEYELYNPRLPITSGFLIPQTLRQLERFNLGDEYGPRSAERYHLFAESVGLAWADRAEYLGDPDFVDVPFEGMQSDSFIEDRSEKIALGETLADYEEGECVEPGDPWAHQDGEGDSDRPSSEIEPDGDTSPTTHFVAADSDGNVAVVTTSINSGFGSGIMVPDYGIMLNNYLALFDADPDSPNAPEGGKGPLSSTSPTLVMKDGSPYFTSGTPTGTTIPQTTLNIILNVIEFDMGIVEAVLEPRMHTTNCPPNTWEEGIPEDAREKTEEWGQVWADDPTEIGAANNLLVEDDTYHGAIRSSLVSG